MNFREFLLLNATDVEHNGMIVRLDSTNVWRMGMDDNDDDANSVNIFVSRFLSPGASVV